MKNRSRFLSLFLSGMMAFTMTACGGETENGNTSGSGNTSDGTSTDTGDSSMYSIDGLENDLEFDENGDPAFYEQVELNLWSIIGDPDLAVHKQLINQFNKEYSGLIHVNLTTIGHYDYYNSLENTYQNDFESFPDICFMHNEKTAQYAYSQYFYCLDDLFDKTHVDFDFSDVYENIDRVTKVDGHRFAIPVDAHGFITSFRQDIIKKNGLGWDDDGDGAKDRYTPKSKAEYQSLLEDLRTKADKNELYIRNITKGEDHSWKIADPDTFYPEFTQSSDPDGLSAIYANGETMATGQTTVNFQNSEGFKSYITDQVDRWNNRLMGESGTSTEAFTAGNTVMFSEGPWWVSETYSVAYNNSELTQVGNGVTEEDANDPIYNTPYIAAHPEGWWTNEDNTDLDTADKWYGNGHIIAITKRVTSLQKAAAALIFAKWYIKGYSNDDETNPEYHLATWCNTGHLPAWKNVYDSTYYQNFVTKSLTLRALGDPEDIIAMESLRYETTIFNGVTNAVTTVQTALKSQNGCTTEQALQLLADTAESTQSALDLYSL